jgi:hypothetical protein
MTLNMIQKRWNDFAQSARGRIIIRVLLWSFMGGIFVYLAWKLTEIGWAAIWAALPTNPLFYVLFLLLYFSVPLSEVFIYRLSWTYPMWQSFPAFLKKRIFNKDVLGYSGEVYFFGWARKHIEASDRVIMETIRDNNIISSVASTLVAVLLVGLFIQVGEFSILDWIQRPNWTYVGIGLLALAILTPVLIRLRRYLYSMPLKLTLIILGIQCIRLLIGQVLQIGQWALVIPDIPLKTWLTLAAILIILVRIPFLANQSLVILGVSVELSSRLGIPEASMFSMMAVLAALDKVLNVGLFLWASSVEGTLERTEAVDDEGGQPGSNGRPAPERPGRNAPSDPETPGSHRVPEAQEP